MSAKILKRITLLAMLFTHAREPLIPILINGGISVDIMNLFLIAINTITFPIMLYLLLDTIYRLPRSYNLSIKRFPITYLRRLFVFAVISIRCRSHAQ